MNFKIKFTILFLCLAMASAFVFISCDEDDDSIGEVSRVSIKTMPKVAYVLGQSFDLTDLVLSLERNGIDTDITFDQFEQEGIIVEPSNGTVLDFTNEYFIVKHIASGKGVTQAIAITNNVVKIEVKDKPKEDYFNGEKLQLSNLVVSLSYEDGSKEDVAYDNFDKIIECTPSNGDVLSTSNPDVVITFVATKVECKLPINVEKFVPISASVVEGPTKSKYEIGDRLDLAGTIIKFTVSDGREIIVLFDDFTAFGIVASPANETKLKASDTELEIEHSDSGVKLMLPITVNALDVIGLTVNMKPEKTVYNDGELIDLTGLEVKLSVSGGNDINVAAVDFGTYGIVATPAHGDAFISGTSEIVISYPGYSETISIPLGADIIYESDFAANGVDAWNWAENGGGSVNVSVVNGELVADDIVVGTNSWDVQLMIPNIMLEQNVKYKYTIIVKAAPGDGDNWLDLSMGDGDGRDGWGNYDGGNGVWLGSDYAYNTVEKEFVMTKATTDAARLVFSIGNSTKGIIIQYVKIEKI